jgi:precorrin-6Y C5,15-methyltransferase (decarboxylating)
MSEAATTSSGSRPVDIVGMGMGLQDLTDVHRGLIARAELLVGGRRHLSLFPALDCLTWEITSDLQGLAEMIQRERRAKRIVVLASGDPLYYGIGAFLLKALGKANVRVHPNITAVAAAFARMGEPWQNAMVVSLHGRRRDDDLARALQSADRIAVFTDPACSPPWVGAFLRERRNFDFGIGVFECLGSSEERVSWHTPESIADQTFRMPNMVILKKETPPGTPPAVLHLGMPEDAYAHERGVITKAEIRAVSLARLGLMPNQILWDLGAGSGAVAIEASLLMPGGRIWAVEKNPRRLEQMRANRDRFGVANLQIVAAQLPQGLTQLPDPDRVFIGGGGEALGDTVALAAHRLPENGILVVNTVLMDSLHETVQRLKASGLATDVVQVQVSRSRPLAGSDRMQAMNPVWIIRGRRFDHSGRR